MEPKRRLNPWWIVLGVAMILLSILVGALAGGVAGYWVGRRATVRAEQNYPSVIPQLPLRPNQPRGQSPVQPVPEVGGALVTEVTRGSPADSAGIQVGDVITAIDGESVGADNTPTALVRKHRPGDTVEIALRTQGNERTVQVKLGSRPEQQDAPYLGISYVLEPQLEDPSVH